METNVITQNFQSLVGLWFLPKLVVLPCLSPFRRPNLNFIPFWLVVFFVSTLDLLSELLFCEVLPEKSQPQAFLFSLRLITSLSTSVTDPFALPNP